MSWGDSRFAGKGRLCVLVCLCGLTSEMGATSEQWRATQDILTQKSYTVLRKSFCNGISVSSNDLQLNDEFIKKCEEGILDEYRTTTTELPDGLAKQRVISLLHELVGLSAENVEVRGYSALQYIRSLDLPPGDCQYFEDLLSTSLTLLSPEDQKQKFLEALKRTLDQCLYVTYSEDESEQEQQKYKDFLYSSIEQFADKSTVRDKVVMWMAHTEAQFTYSEICEELLCKMKENSVVNNIYEKDKFQFYNDEDPASGSNHVVIPSQYSPLPRQTLDGGIATDLLILILLHEFGHSNDAKPRVLDWLKRDRAILANKTLEIASSLSSTEVAPLEFRQLPPETKKFFDKLMAFAVDNRAPQEETEGNEEALGEYEPKHRLLQGPNVTVEGDEQFRLLFQSIDEFQNAFGIVILWDEQSEKYTVILNKYSDLGTRRELNSPLRPSHLGWRKVEDYNPLAWLKIHAKLDPKGVSYYERLEEILHSY